MMFSATLVALTIGFAIQVLAAAIPDPRSVDEGGITPAPPSPTSWHSSPWQPPTSEPSPVNPCAAIAKAKPLQRAYIGGATSAADHFYTTDQTSMAYAISYGYKQEANVGKVHTSQQSGTTPLYRLFNEAASDHYYTDSTQERENAVNMYGYKDEGIAAYVYVDNRCGGVPLYMLFSASASDHFYTTSEAEANASGYQRERIVGYVLPA